MPLTKMSCKEIPLENALEDAAPLVEWAENPFILALTSTTFTHLVKDCLVTGLCGSTKLKKRAPDDEFLKG